MQDKRSSPRRRVNDDIEILDINSGQTLGHLGNISSGGFMLLANTAPNTGQLFQLRMLLPTPLGEAPHIELGAECLWCDASASGNQIWAGFQIIDITDEAIVLIDQLIDAWTG